MTVLTGFVIIYMALLVLYMMYRMVKLKKFIMLVPIALQIISLSIAITSSINGIETNTALQVSFITTGIVVPSLFLIYDYSSLISRLKNQYKINSRIEFVPSKKKEKQLTDLSEKYINPPAPEQKTAYITDNIKLDSDEILNNLKRLLTKAQFYLSNRDINKAEEIYKVLVKLIKASQGIYYNYANICYETGNYSEASSYYSKALELHRRNKKEKERKDWLVTIAKSKKDSSPELKDMLDRENDIDLIEASIYYNLGNTEYRRNRLEQAVEYYKKAIDINPDMKQASENIAASLVALGQIEEAIQYYEKIIRAKNSGFRSNYMLASLYQDSKMYDKAIKQYYRCLEMNRGSIEVYNQLGKVLLKSGKNEEAIEAFERLKEFDPEDYSVYYNQAMAYFKTGNMDDAIKCFETAVKIKPDSYKCYYNMALALDEAGKHGEAIAAFRKSLEYKDDFLDAYNNLGISLSTQGRYSEAIDTYVKGLNKAPDEYSLYYNLGITLSEMGRYNEAVKVYQKALAIKPDANIIYYHLGNAMTELRRYDEAISAYKEALSVKTDDSNILYNLAIVYSIIGKHDIAMDTLKKAIESDSDLRDDARYNSAFTGLKAREDFQELIS